MSEKQQRVKKTMWGGKIPTYKCTKCHFASRVEREVEIHYARRHGVTAAAPAKAVSRMNVPELEAHADSLGIDRGAIEGTGADGSVVKQDLLAAIAAATTS